jgi:signal peptidase I
MTKRSNSSDKVAADNVTPGSEPSRRAGGAVGIWQGYREWRRVRKQRQMERRLRIGPIRDWIETVISVVLIVFVIRVAAVEAYRIPTGSMENTLLVGDFLLVNKFVYGIRTPDWLGVPFTPVGFNVPYTRLPGVSDIDKGDILVFRYPMDQRVNYIKRCVAVSGQTLQIIDKQLYIDGIAQELPEDGKFTDHFVLPADLRMRQMRPRGAGNKDNYGPVTVPDGYLFMMGDNRDNSADSRYWGFLDEDLVLGKAEIIYFSWDKLANPSKFWTLIRWTRMFSLIR